MEIDHQGRDPLYVQISDVLRAEIKRGVYPPGKPLPSETSLSQRFEVSRLTARRAVRILTSEGLVEVSPGRGAFVTRR